MTYSQLSEALKEYADEHEVWDDEVDFQLVEAKQEVALEMSDARGFLDGVIFLERAE